MMAGDEPDEASMPVKDTEVRCVVDRVPARCSSGRLLASLSVAQLVPTRDMVKHKARVVVQRLQKQKKAAGKAEGGDSGKLAE